MCGIAGYIGKQPIDKTLIKKTLDLMKNRGPDFQNYISFLEGDNYISLLHSRLSIIDLDKRSNQPFVLGDDILVFNGEIYNYIELRQELENRNISFITESDTEVLLRYYQEYGEECVNFFEGMWSFAIYNRKRRTLFLSRDRFAEKPLYYYNVNNNFYFASEIKFIKQLLNTKLIINNEHILRYLINGYKSLYKTNELFFKDIQELSYASNMVINQSLQKKIYHYWEPEYKPKRMTIEESIEGTNYLLKESVKLRLRSDVPLAFCLSGGIDSAGLASIASKIFNYNVVTYSIIDNDERYNEYDNINIIINDIKSKSNLIVLSNTGNCERLKKLIEYHDSPISTISYLVHSYISEAISKDGYKVVFSGTGADEMLTGYYDHFNLHLYEVKNHPNYNKYKSDWQYHIEKYIRNPYLKDPELYFKDKDFRDHIYLNNKEFASLLKKDFYESFIEEDYSDFLLRNRMLNEMFHEGTRVILHEDDLNSMMYSIENRSPYLDRKLFEFCYTIPNEFLIMNGYGKYILREALDGILNDKVRLDRRKKGFNASINTIIDFDNKEEYEYLMADSPIYDLIEKNKIKNIFKMNPMPNSFSKFIFNFINAKIFLETML